MLMKEKEKNHVFNIQLNTTSEIHIEYVLIHVLPLTCPNKHTVIGKTT